MIIYSYYYLSFIYTFYMCITMHLNYLKVSIHRKKFVYLYNYGYSEHHTYYRVNIFHHKQCNYQSLIQWN